MKARFYSRLTIAAMLAWGLGATATAVADDGFAGESLLVRAAPPALALASAAALAELPPPAPHDVAAPPDARQLLDGPRRPSVEPSSSGNPSRPKKVPLLTDEILRELGELPLLDTVMMPVTRGVTFETGEGGPAVTVAVKPTKITRGSGLVAIGRF